MKQTWHQQQGETDQKYTWFQIYLKQGPKRRLEKVAQDVGKSKKTIERISTKNNWIKRTEDYDSHQNKKLAQKYEDQWNRLNRQAFTSTVKEMGALNKLFR